MPGQQVPQYRRQRLTDHPFQLVELRGARPRGKSGKQVRVDILQRRLKSQYFAAVAHRLNP